MEKFLTKTDFKIFLIKGLNFIFLAWVLFSMTLLKSFYLPVSIFLLIIFSFFSIKYAIKNNLLKDISKEFIFISIILLFLSIFFSAFSQPTIFSGRDQGSIAEASLRLAQNHQLEFKTKVSEEFFNIYGPGKALNFPGFYYTIDGNLTTQFPLVYIAWLAFFYQIFGLLGLTIANTILLYIFLLSFYMLGRIFMPTRFSLLMLLFSLTSFAFIWFSKFTLSENMALSIVWFCIFSLVLFFKNPTNISLLATTTSAFLLCFTRIEGFAITMSVILILFLNKSLREFICKRPFRNILLPLFIFILFFILNFINDFYFYKEIIKAIIPDSLFPQAKTLGTLNKSFLPSFYLEKIFLAYGMATFFIIGAIGLVLLIFKKRKGRLIPFFVILPTIIYFFDYHITPDHPWMLRRFIFTLFPAAILYSTLLFAHMYKYLGQKMRFLKISLLFFVIILMILINLSALMKYFTFYENKDLLKQTLSMSDNFSKDDLILVDRLSSGDAWSIITTPMNFLDNKNAVYFFNNQDLSKIDTSKFNNIYLIVSNNSVSSYLNSTIGQKLNFYKDYNFQTYKLIQAENNNDFISLPQKKLIETNGKIFKISK